MEGFEKFGQRSLPNTLGNTGSVLFVARVNFWAITLHNQEDLEITTGQTQGKGD